QIEGKAQETESLRATITAEVRSPKTLLEILKNSNTLAEDRRQAYLKGLSKVLECIQSQHFDSAIAFLPDSPPGQTRELLFESKLLRSSALETTRGLAARYLAEVASTDEAYRLLEGVAHSKPWHNSKAVREAAAAAVARLTERAQQALEARKSAAEAKRA